MNPLSLENDSEDESGRARPSSKIWEAFWTTTTTLMCVGIAGYGYHKYYKGLTLRKIENAFSPGDPALDLVPRGMRPVNLSESEEDDHWVTRLVTHRHN